MYYQDLETVRKGGNQRSNKEKTQNKDKIGKVKQKYLVLMVLCGSFRVYV
jgi:hypothetical protein